MQPGHMLWFVVPEPSRRLGLSGALSMTNKPWLCEKCGQHMIWHGLTPPPGRKPICPEKPLQNSGGEELIRKEDSK